MKKVKKLKNVSNEKITLDHGSNVQTVLPPGAEVSDIEVANCSELEKKAVITYDLTEVTEASMEKRLDS